MVPALFVAASSVAAACSNGNGGDDGAVPSTTSTTTEFVQHRFHDLIANGVRNRMVQLIPDRFELDESSVREIDLYPEANANQRVEIEFQTQQELNEFAVEQGMIGFYNADFTASGGQEFWAIFTQVFRTLDGPPAVYERFADPETAVIEDAERVGSTELELSGATGRASVDEYLYEDGLTTYAMRGAVVDGNALHFVSAIVDVPVGDRVDGGAEMRRVLEGLNGLHRSLFEEFLRIGGRDEPLEGADEGDDEGADEDSPEGLPGDG